jgi:catechol 2,3-dioxygenase-like lactoylglutathione lyase family enzyme
MYALEDPMSRLQLALNVPDLDAAVAFYSKLFATEPAKRKPGYANFAVADPPLKLVLFEQPGAEARLNHLGVEVPTPADVTAATTRLNADGVDTAEGSGTCCFADQQKVWVDAPDGAWEIYAVLADAEEFGTASGRVEESCCGPDCATSAEVEPAAEATATACC